MSRTAPRARRERPVCPSTRHEHDRNPPRVSPGRQLCAGCRDQLEEDLVELPGLYELCAYMLDLRGDHLRERVSGHRPRGIVLHESVVAIRSDILGVLAAWCGLVTGERGVPGPDELSIRRLTSFLAIHVNWLTEHPAAADLADELAELTRAAQEVLRPSAGFVLNLGHCPRPDCDRVLRAEGPVAGAPPQRVSCEAGHTWAPDQWLQLWGQQNEAWRDPFPEGAE